MAFGSLSLSGTTAGVLRHTGADAWLVGLAILHGLLLVVGLPWWAISLGFWWNTNTVAHNFIHLPFFRSRALNRSFSFYLSLVLGIPQRLWRDRHLAHHAGRGWRWTLSTTLVTEGLAVLAMWTLLLVFAPDRFWTAHLPGLVAGLALCGVQGHFEHARGTTSHHGRIYNWLFFNDGYHLEHHVHPGVHWTRLGEVAHRDERPSRWPPVFRWLEWSGLDLLEGLLLALPGLQGPVMRWHGRALRRLLSGLPPIRTVVVVGGGLFPRTALLLRECLPDCRITILESDAGHLDVARRFLGPEVELVQRHYEGDELPGCDLAVVPLAFRGDRRALYRRPPARHLLVHDWWWRPAGRTASVSILLLKRLNLVGI